jgi:hypothetical protein
VNHQIDVGPLFQIHTTCLSPLVGFEEKQCRPSAEQFLVVCEIWTISAFFFKAFASTLRAPPSTWPLCLEQSRFFCKNANARVTPRNQRNAGTQRARAINLKQTHNGKNKQPKNTN